jgi:hypothetical protein
MNEKGAEVFIASLKALYRNLPQRTEGGKLKLEAMVFQI